MDFTTQVTNIGVKALNNTPADEVALGMMTGALNVCLELLPHQEVADWLRRLASEIENHDPASPSRIN